MEPDRQEEGRFEAPSGSRDHLDWPPVDIVAAVGCDLLLRLDEQGTIVWADERAKALLGARSGGDFFNLMAAFQLPKAERFLAAARAGQTEPWELFFGSEDEPLLLLVVGAPWCEDVIVAANRLPQHYAITHEQVAAAINEISVLHREAARQQEELRVAYNALEAASLLQAEQARLEGVLLSARSLAHNLNNALMLPYGLLELLQERRDLPPSLMELVAQGHISLQKALEHVAQLGRVVRVETQETLMGPALDLERSSSQDRPG
jgi:PAS domain-containing protein